MSTTSYAFFFLIIIIGKAPINVKHIEFLLRGCHFIEIETIFRLKILLQQDINIPKDIAR